MVDLEHARELRFVMKKVDAGVFMPLLQGGFMVRCKTGVTIETLLMDCFGITREYMERRLSTVFLDGECIDDIDVATVHSGMVLALSSAMPGLVGATLRRKGILAPMRASITHRENITKPAAAGYGFVTIKLFNVLAGEIGPAFLARGIYLKAADLAGLLGARGKAFRLNISKIILDNRDIDLEQALNELAEEADGLIKLIVG